MEALNVAPEAALLHGQVNGMIAPIYSNERPLRGLAGCLDWRFRSQISIAIAGGLVTGEIGECVYFPITKQGRTFHLIFLGAGQSSKIGERRKISDASWIPLRKNLKSLGLKGWGFPLRDLGDLKIEEARKLITPELAPHVTWISG